MNRALLLAAAGLVATGCYSSPTYVTPLSDVVVYWNFQRHLLDGTTVPYDGNVNPGGGSGPCSQSGADFVVVTFPDGSLVDPQTPTISCVFSGVQGVTFAAFQAGSYTFVVTGYRDGVAAPLFTGQNSISVVNGADNRVTVTAPGVQGNLTTLYDIAGFRYSTCLDADVQRFDFTLRDGSNTVIATDSAGCNANATPGVDFGLVDLDNYFLSVDAVTTSTNPESIVGSICRTAFNHFGISATVFDDTLRFNLPAGVCQNP